MAYYKINIPYELEKHKRKWTNQISHLRCAMEKADQEMARNYTPGASAIAKYILYKNQGQSNQALANEKKNFSIKHLFSYINQYVCR